MRGRGVREVTWTRVGERMRDTRGQPSESTRLGGVGVGRVGGVGGGARVRGWIGADNANTSRGVTPLS